jgi:hypothetical protein
MAVSIEIKIAYGYMIWELEEQFWTQLVLTTIYGKYWIISGLEEDQ